VRSLPLAFALESAHRLIEAGHQEIVLSGIHIGAYGEDLPQGQGLSALIGGILRLPGTFRLRLGSIEPHQFNAELLRLFASEQRICPHLHIPLQSGSDQVLCAMNRTYNTKDYEALLKKVRAVRPGCAITTDVLIGYPGETGTDFMDTMDFCRQMAFARLHVFPYSKRPGTVAAGLPGQLPQKEKERRAALLGKLAHELSESYAQAHIGAKLEYLHEQEITFAGQRYHSGHSGNYLPLLLPASGPPPPGLWAVQGKECQDGFVICE
jgi:threonylcarbamoyladenosine tRNA methylthiotransferase MtaB